MTDQITVLNRRMLESLVCPITEGTLHYDATRQELISKDINLAFPIRDGIPIMLISEARKLDWNIQYHRRESGDLSHHPNS